VILENLPIGSYLVTEVQAPLGYELSDGDPKTVWVSELEQLTIAFENPKRIESDTQEDQDVDGNRLPNSGAGSQSGGQRAPKTGDEWPVIPYSVLLGLCLIIAVYSGYRLRRKR